LQNLGARCLGVPPQAQSPAVFTDETASLVSALQKKWALTENGIVDPQFASLLMERCQYDYYLDDGSSAGSKGYKYKVVIPVYR
jgi:hypothetical protein